MTVGRAMARGFGHPVTWLVILVALFFYKEVFFGRVFSPADQLYDFQPWSSVRPPTYTHASNPLRVDESFIFFPRRDQIASDIKRFGLPLWDEHNFAGMPDTFSINFIGAFVFPPMWSYLALPPGVANTLLHIPIPLLAALCMYLLLGRLTRYRTVRLLGAIAWGLNGYVVVWLSAFFLPLTMAVLPLLIYLAIRFLDEGRIIFGLAYAVMLGWSFFLGYQPANVIVVTFLAIYLACWLFVDLRGRFRRFLAVAGLSALGLGVAALPIITSVIQLSGVVGHRGVLPPLPFADLQTFLFPNIFGNPVAADWRRADGNYCEYIAYVGSIPLVLGLAGTLAALRKRDFRLPLVSAGLITGFVSLVVAYSVGPAALLQRLPVFADIRPARWHVGMVFAAVLLAAYGLDLLMSKQLPLWTLRAAAGLTAVAAGAILVLHRGDFGGRDVFIRQDEVLRIAVLAAGILVLLAFRWLRAPLAAGLLCLILAVDLFSFGTDFNPAIRSSDFYPQTPALRYLEAHAAGYRVLVAREAGLLWPGDVLPVYGIDSITGYDHLQDSAYVRLLGSNISPAEIAFWRNTGYLTLGQSLRLDSAVFNLLSVRYAFYPDDPSGKAGAGLDHWQLVYAASDGAILENTQALPAQFSLTSGNPVPVGIDHTASAPDHDRLNAQGPATLVWSRPYSTNWQILVDGRRATAASFNGYFLSTTLPPGTHAVTVQYEARDWEVGSALSLLSLLALAALGLLSWRRRHGPA